MKYYLSFLLVCLLFNATAVRLWGQSFFFSQQPLEIGLKFSIKNVAKSKEDSVYLFHELYYKNNGQQPDSIKVGLKSRGNFRLATCYFPPLWIKLDKKRTKGTMFQGIKKLKLVLPCHNYPASNVLVLKEYLCYKLYEAISPYAFLTRLANINLVEIKGKRSREFQLKGIFIEDIEATAKRFHGKAMEALKLPSVALQDTGAIRFYLFQLMISNTDLSTKYQHNTKLLKLKTGEYFSLPYDFDMSGVVDAPYAVVSQIGDEKLDAENVRDRLYRGICRSEEVTQFVRNEFLQKEKLLMSIVDSMQAELPKYQIEDIKIFLNDFFDILKSDALFKSQVLDRCLKV